jgi:hypothetical protein
MRKHFIQHTRQSPSLNSSLYILPSTVMSPSIHGVAMTSWQKSKEGNTDGEYCTCLDNS